MVSLRVGDIHDAKFHQFVNTHKSIAEKSMEDRLIEERWISSNKHLLMSNEVKVLRGWEIQSQIEISARCLEHINICGYLGVSV